MAERAEPASVLGEGVAARLVAELSSALKRKPAREAQLGGALRALFLHAPELRRELTGAFDLLVRRGSFERPLYGAIARGLAEAQDAASAPALAAALATDDGGGFATLSAAAFSRDAALAAPLAHLASNRHAHLAFAAELARVARGESNGARGAAIAPMIKETHRLSLCEEVLAPWAWREPIGAGLGPGFAALRGAERHLGRWLLLAELGARAGDTSALGEAEREAVEGAPGTRPAWALVAWALGSRGPELPVRPTLEVVVRLSDRPTADKDASFLFRLAENRAGGARSLLRHLARGPLESATAVRAALHLLRDFGETNVRNQLVQAAESTRREPLRGLAAAALFDAGEREIALDVARKCAHSQKLPTLTFANLVLAAASSGTPTLPLVTEARVRQIQLGWVP